MQLYGKGVFVKYPLGFLKKLLPHPNSLPAQIGMQKIKPRNFGREPLLGQAPALQIKKSPNLLLWFQRPRTSRLYLHSGFGKGPSRKTAGKSGSLKPKRKFILNVLLVSEPYFAFSQSRAWPGEKIQAKMQGVVAGQPQHNGIYARTVANIGAIRRLPSGVGQLLF